jgi:L-asparagine oxygenase
MSPVRQTERLAFPQPVRRELYGRLAALGSPYRDVEDFLVSLYPIFAALPRPLLAPLLAFRNDPAAPGFLVLENCPVDAKLSATPPDGKRSAAKKTFVSDACVLGLCQLLGEPLAYHGEKDGELIQNLCPVASEAARTSSESSELSLGFHTDFDFDEAHPESPYNITNADFIVLLCLRADPGHEAYTLYADAREVCARLTPEEIEILRSPLFQFRASYSFTERRGIGRPWCSPTAILRGPRRYPEISIDMLCGVRGINDEAARALSRAASVCSMPDVCQRVGLRSGDALLINNRKGAHGRTAFSVVADGRNRWLQRVYVRRSLWELRSDFDRPPRVF